MQTIQDYIDAARVLLQDKMEPYRYDDDQFRVAMTVAFDNSFRVRPDFFIRNDIPDFMTAPLDTTDVPAPKGYQSAFMYYLAGHVELQNQEETSDARAASLLNKFTAQLLSTAS